MKYSLVVPIYFDGYLAPALCSEVHHTMAGFLGSPGIRDHFELIFVNDGSTDGSLQALLDLQYQYDFVRVIDLSRNFGQHAAIACGIREARGEIVMRMNVDLQDPPSEIPKLLRVLEESDTDLAVGQYESRESPWIDRLTAHVYFVVFKFLTGFEIRQNTSPLRAMSRRFVDAYNALTEKSQIGRAHV